MWIVYVIIGVVVLAVAIFFIATTVRKTRVPPNQDLLTELKNLKDKGLISEQEYKEKVAELKARKGGKNE